MALIPLGADPLPSLGWRKSIMASDSEDLLLHLSAALASATTVSVHETQLSWAGKIMH
jgi:hypothetical protein